MPLARIGAGAFGNVWRMHDTRLGIDVAVKFLGAVSAAAVSGLKHEFRTVAGISHPNLVQLYELFVDDESACFSMELLEGDDFVSAVQQRFAGGAGDVSPLVAELCSGLSALHEAGLVHGDVKPGNVLVTREGRAVVVDFGFVRDRTTPRAVPSLQSGVAGTYAYMAPEQLLGGEATAASDGFATGVMLHEALSGELPLIDLGRSCTCVLPDRVTDPLRSLVTALLAHDPSERPPMSTIAMRLRRGRGASTPLAAPRSTTAPGDAAAAARPFIGRVREKDWLRQHVGTPAVLEVCGESGVGKTELVRRTLADLPSDEFLVLQSRCRPTESVSYQALDGAVDGLGIALATMQDALPPAAFVHAARAATLFPVLAGAGDTDLSSAAPADPVEARRQAVGHLRSLLATMQAQRRVVLWIDDAQWAEADSIAMAGELLDTPDAPGITWVLTTRTESAEASPLGRALEAVARRQQWACGRRTIAPLDEGEAEDLVRALLPDQSLSAAALGQLLESGRGSPFLLSSFASALFEPGQDGAVAADYASVLRASTADLDSQERLALDLVALGRQATEQSIVLEAAEIGMRGIPLLQKLEARRLVRSAPGHRGVVVDAYHDRVLETLLSTLSGQDVREGHLRLARAHLKHGSEPALLSHHFHGAGDLPAASTYAEQAGRRADATLAFASAADFYRNARLWDATTNTERKRSLLQLEGSALANAGSLAEAGERYLEASAFAARLEALELRRRAVESLLAGGRIDRGLEELRSLTEGLSLRYPRSEAGALARGIGSLVSYGVSPSRVPRDCDETERLRIDTCYSVGRRLADVDPSRGSYFLAASLARAARSGDAFRLARSLVTAGGALGAVGGRTINRFGDRMMARASRMAEELGNEELRGMIDVAYGEIHMLAGRWRSGLERARAGVARLMHKPGFVFECSTGRGVVLRVLEELGEFAQEYDEARQLLEDAVAHRNAYVEIRAAQHLTVACLALGRSAEARSYLATGFDRWMEGVLQMQHLYAVRNEAWCDLHDGDHEHGMALMDSVEPGFRRSALRQIPLIRIDMTWLRGQLALARAVHGDRTSGVALALDAARRLEREHRQDARLRALLLRAGAMSWTRNEEAVVALREAIEAACAMGARHFEQAARHALAGCGKHEDAGGEAAADAAGGDGAALYAAVWIPGAWSDRSAPGVVNGR